MLRRMIVRAMNWLSPEELMEVGRTAKVIGAEKHGVYFPWIIWSREDFSPETLGVDGVDEKDYERVMDRAWSNTLEDRHFLELDDDDWARVHWAIYGATDDLGIDGLERED